MFFLSTGCRWGLALLLAMSLGACQRAVYQFQTTEKASAQLAPPALAAESATVIVAVPLVAQSSKNYRRVATGRRTRIPAGRVRHLEIPHLSMLRTAVAATSIAASAHRQQQEPGPVVEPVHYRSRTIAILLALLSISYLPLSLHNFYLGYYGRGALAIALVVVGGSLTVLGLLGGLFSSGGLGVVGVVGLAMLIGWLVWQFSDLIRIITKDLKPKNGEYR